MEDESKRIQIDPSNIQYTKRNMPQVHTDNVQLPKEDFKYIGLDLDRKFVWYKHISAKQKQLGITLTKMY
jgi:hypothetical protein